MLGEAVAVLGNTKVLMPVGTSQEVYGICDAAWDCDYVYNLVAEKNFLIGLKQYLLDSPEVIARHSLLEKLFENLNFLLQGQRSELSIEIVSIMAITMLLSCNDDIHAKFVGIYPEISSLKHIIEVDYAITRGSSLLKHHRPAFHALWVQGTNRETIRYSSSIIADELITGDCIILQCEQVCWWLRYHANGRTSAHCIYVDVLAYYTNFLTTFINYNCQRNVQTTDILVDQAAAFLDAIPCRAESIPPITIDHLIKFYDQAVIGCFFYSDSHSYIYCELLKCYSSFLTGDMLISHRGINEFIPRYVRVIQNLGCTLLSLITRSNPHGEPDNVDLVDQLVCTYLHAISEAVNIDFNEIDYACGLVELFSFDAVIQTFFCTVYAGDYESDEAAITRGDWVQVLKKLVFRQPGNARAIIFEVSHTIITRSKLISPRLLLGPMLVMEISNLVAYFSDDNAGLSDEESQLLLNWIIND